VSFLILCLESSCIHVALALYFCMFCYRVDLRLDFPRVEFIRCSLVKLLYIEIYIYTAVVLETILIFQD